jgi:hypothetical protein
MRHLRHLWPLVAFVLAACGSGDDGTPMTPATTYSVSGTLVAAGGTVVLEDNGGDDLSLTAAGTFSFATKLAAGASYAVTIKTAPTAERLAGLAPCGDDAQARAALARGAQWLRRTLDTQVPEPFRANFVRANPVNEQLRRAADGGLRS